MKKLKGSKGIKSSFETLQENRMNKYSKMLIESLTKKEFYKDIYDA